jgi:outer membrane protein assembly factor BamB
VTLNGAATATTDSGGAFSLTGLANGAYTLSVSFPGTTFTPASQSIAVSGADVGSVLFQSCNAIVPTGSKAVAYQIDPAHSGAQPGDTLSLPLCQRWSANLGAPVSFPLVADGRVFVTVGSTSLSNTSLVALDEATGAILWGPIATGGIFFRANAAYDNGRVFVVNYDGLLRAFDAATGALLWSAQMPGQQAFTSPPTAAGGHVYLGAAGGNVSSVEEIDGGVDWTALVQGGDNSSPALAGGSVFVSYACNQSYAFEQGDGGLIWHHSGPCSGGGGKTVALGFGKVYTRDFEGDLVLDQADGGESGTYSSTFAPAFSATNAFATTGTLQALQPDGGVSWSFDAGVALSTAPLVVGSQVVVATPSTLFVLDAATGAVKGSAAQAGILGPDEQNVSGPLAGFAAADGRLFVPAGTSLIAY